MSNNQIVFYDKVWDVSRNLALAITMADVASHSQNTRNGYITLVNVQNVSNTELDFIPFEVGETIYANDSNLVFTFTALDQVVYLDAPLTSNGYNNSGYGFQTGDTITQFCPQESVDVVLTEEEFLSLCGCSKCGCASSDCACDGGPTVTNRTVTVVTSQERTITATVMFENNDPPYLVVKDAAERFCRYPITNGTITANVVGALAPQAKGNVYNGNYVIERPALYETSNTSRNLGLYLGPHIGIDRHFNNKRSQDYNNDYIIVSNWDTTGNNVPIGQVLDYFSDANTQYIAIGMNVTKAAVINSESKLMHLQTVGNTKANVIVYANTTADNTGKLFILENNSNTFFSVSENTATIYSVNTSINATLHTKSYSEYVQSYHTANGNVWLSVSNATVYRVTSATNTINSLIFIKPTENLNRAYSLTVKFEGINTFSTNCWTTANVQWPGGVAPTYSPGAPTIFSFLNAHDTLDMRYNSDWYGFNPFNVVTGEVTAQVTDDNIPCLLVSLDSYTYDGSYDIWLQALHERFKGRYPNRKLYMLRSNTAALPSTWGDYENDMSPITINLDYGNCSNTSDWFELCGFDQLPSGSSVAFSYNGPGSGTMNNAFTANSGITIELANPSTVPIVGSFNLFRQKCCNANIKIIQLGWTDDGYEQNLLFSYFYRILFPTPGARPGPGKLTTTRIIQPCQVLNGVPPGC